jgi:hypothetical protein
VAQLTQEVRSDRGRLVAMQKDLGALKTAPVAVAQRPTEAAVAKAQKNPEKWEALKAEFPEWAEAIEARIAVSEGREAPAPDLRGLTSELNERIEKMNATFQRGLQEAVVFGAYRNWRALVNTPEFTGWWKAQPPEIQRLSSSESGEDAVRMLDLFAEQTRDAKRDVRTERKSILDAAAESRRPAAPPPKGDREKSAAELWAEESRQRAAARESRYK